MMSIKSKSNSSSSTKIVESETFNEEGLGVLLRTTQDCLKNKGLGRRKILKVREIISELFQNQTLYTESSGVDATISVSVVGNKVHVNSSGTVTRRHFDRLQRTLKSIGDQYGDQLRRSPTKMGLDMLPAKISTPSLGLLMVARAASKPLEYSLLPTFEGAPNYQLSVVV